MSTADGLGDQDAKRPSCPVHPSSGGRDDLVPIGVAAEMLGVSPAALRVWDRQGFLKPLRTFGGHRRYRAQDLTRVLQVMAHDLGQGNGGSGT